MSGQSMRALPQSGIDNIPTASRLLMMILRRLIHVIENYVSIGNSMTSRMTCVLQGILVRNNGSSSR